MINHQGKNEQKGQGEPTVADPEGTEPAGGRRGRLRLEERIEAHFFDIFNYSPSMMGITRYDNGKYLEVNESWCRYFGYRREEAIGRTALEMNLWADPEERRRIVGALLEGKEINNEMITYRTKSGEIRQGLFSPRLVEIDGIQCFLFVLNDITEMKQTEERRRRKEERFRLLAENARDIIFRFTLLPALACDYISPSIFVNLGYREEEFYADPELIIKTTHPEDRPLLYSFNRSAELLNKPIIVRKFRKDGSLIYTEHQSTPVYNRQGEIVAIEGITRDVSERMRVEAELKESEERYRRIVETANEGIWTIDANCITTFVNQRMAQMLGYSAAEMLGRPHLDFIDPGWRPSVEERRRALNNGERESFECQLIRHDGTALWTYVSVAPIVDQNGAYTGAVGMLSDITARKQAEEELQQYQERLEDLVAERTVEWQTLNTRLLQEIQQRNAAEESRSLLIDIIESTSDFVATTDTKGRIVYANRTAHRILQLGEGKELPKLLIIDEDAECKQKVIRDGIWQGETTFITAGGEVIPVSQVIIAHKKPDGTVTHLSTIARDITERKQAEEALKKSEERFRTIFNNASVGVLLADQDGYLLNVNEATGRALGFSEQELIGANISAFIHPDDRETGRTQADSLLAGEINCYVCQKRFRRRDGGIVWGRLNVSLIRDDGGRPLYQVIVFENITPLVVVEDEIKAQHLITEAMLGALEEASPPPNLSASSDRFNNFGNLIVSLRQTGYEEAVAKRVLQVACELTGAEKGAYYDFDELNDSLKILCTAGLPPKMELQSKRQYNFKLGEEEGLTGYVARTKRPLYLPKVMEDPRWWIAPVIDTAVKSCYIVPLCYGEKLYGVYFLFSHQLDGFSQEQRYLADVLAYNIASAIENARLFEEAQNAYESLASLQQQLYQAQKMEAIGQLAGGMAHELNNQLTIIQASIDMQFQQTHLDDTLQRTYQRIRKASEKAANITRQLLLFGRKHPQFKITVDINQSIEETMKMVEHLIGEDITIQLDLQPGLWPVHADVGNIDQVIINLLLNARDAMPQGGLITIESANVDIRQTGLTPHRPLPTSQFVRLSIIDTGQGMDEDLLGRIFEPFFTTKEPGKGTGLGLAVVYGIIEAHDGLIDVSSQVGQGSRFDLYLPALTVKSDNSITKVIPSSYRRPGGRGEKILLVEDDPGVMKLTRTILSENGYQVDAYRKVAEAEAAFERDNGRYDLLITDIILPDGRGTDLALKLTGRNRSLAVLLISGYADDRVNLERVKENGFSFIPKPYSVENLLEQINKLHCRGNGLRKPVI